jgi:predicted DNA-binding transcriptional regulator AlpA
VRTTPSKPSHPTSEPEPLAKLADNRVADVLAHRHQDRGNGDDDASGPRRRLVRFSWLKALGVVENRPQLTNLVRDEGFPPGFYLGSKTRVWWDTDVEEWLDKRPVATSKAAKQPPHSRERTGKGRGRPRKATAQADSATGAHAHEI